MCELLSIDRRRAPTAVPAHRGCDLSVGEGWRTGAVAAIAGRAAVVAVERF